MKKFLMVAVIFSVGLSVVLYCVAPKHGGPPVVTQMPDGSFHIDKLEPGESVKIPVPPIPWVVIPTKPVSIMGHVEQLSDDEEYYATSLLVHHMAAKNLGIENELSEMVGAFMRLRVANWEPLND